MIVLSWTDLLRAATTAWKKIALAALIMGCVLFAWQLRKPLVYTSLGVFKAASSSPTLKLLNADSPPHDDAKGLLCSYPVLERVVRTQSLQATLSQQENRLAKLWHRFLAEGMHAFFRKQLRPASSILDGTISVPDKLWIPEKQCPLTCEALTYHGETFLELTLLFNDAEHFTVLHGRQILGNGTLNTPFSWEGGSFTLSQIATAQTESATLTLIPLPAAVNSLKKRIKIARDKNNPHLLEISLSHPNRHLGAEIINGVMREYHHYLADENKKKMSQQLAYLTERQQQTLAGFGQELTTLHGSDLHLSHDTHATSLLEEQKTKKKQLSSLVAEMQRLAQTKDLEKILSHASQEVAPELTLESVRKKLHSWEKEHEVLAEKQETYALCLSKLADPSCALSSLSSAIDESSLKPLLTQAATWEQHLIDETNWSAKERAIFQEELIAHRGIVRSQLDTLLEGIAFQTCSLEEKIGEMKQSALALLAQDYQATEKKLRSLALDITELPGTWIAEKQIALSTKMYQNAIYALTEMIETKNLEHHSESFDSRPLLWAHPPTLPDPPKLRLYGLAGALFGALGVILALALREAWLGPTASAENLRAAGFQVIGVEDDPLTAARLRARLTGEVLIVASPFLTKTLAPALSPRETSDPFEIETASKLIYCPREKRIADLAVPEHTLFVVPKEPSFSARLLSSFRKLKRKLK